MSKTSLSIYTEPEDVRPVQTRGRRDTSGRMAPGEPIDPAATYALSLWDHEIGDFAPEFTGLRRMGLRAAIRAVETMGYCSMGYLVEREVEATGISQTHVARIIKEGGGRCVL